MKKKREKRRGVEEIIKVLLGYYRDTIGTLWGYYRDAVNGGFGVAHPVYNTPLNSPQHGFFLSRLLYTKTHHFLSKIDF